MGMALLSLDGCGLGLPRKPGCEASGLCFVYCRAPEQFTYGHLRSIRLLQQNTVDLGLLNSTCLFSKASNTGVWRGLLPVHQSLSPMAGLMYKGLSPIHKDF